MTHSEIVTELQELAKCADVGAKECRPGMNDATIKMFAQIWTDFSRRLTDVADACDNLETQRE